MTVFAPRMVNTRNEIEMRETDLETSFRSSYVSPVRSISSCYGSFYLGCFRGVRFAERKEERKGVFESFDRRLRVECCTTNHLSDYSSLSADS